MSRSRIATASLSLEATYTEAPSSLTVTERAPSSATPSSQAPPASEDAAVGGGLLIQLTVGGSIEHATASLLDAAT